MFSCSPPTLNFDLHGIEQFPVDEALVAVVTCEISRFEAELLPNCIGCWNSLAIDESKMFAAAVLSIRKTTCISDVGQKIMDDLIAPLLASSTGNPLVVELDSQTVERHVP